MNKSGTRRKSSLFSLRQGHKEMLRKLAKEGDRSMTAELERIIEKEYNDPYRRYLKNPGSEGM